VTRDPQLLLVFGVVLAVLVLGTLVATVLWVRQRRRPEGVSDTVKNLAARVRAWWVMVAIIAGTSVVGPLGLFALYTLLSALALRELLTLTPTHRADHGALVFAFFFVVPLQYAFAAMGWYVMFLIFVPVYAFVAIPVLLALRGEPARFLDRSAKIQWGVLVAVYFVSYVPMLQYVPIAGFPSGSGRLTFFLALVAQLSDVFQYVFGKLFGKHKVSPTISPQKTVEGLLGGGLSAVLVGTALYSVTPFGPGGACLLSLVIVATGFLGGLVMSAVKRSLGAKDWGAAIEGHGGVFDRLDSIAFAAPIMFHLVVFFADVEVPNVHPPWLDALTHLRP
jgi:phosphatidate cytidylyltransferase